MPSLLTQMHRVIPGYAYNFFWINPRGEVSNAYHENFEETQVTVPLFLSEFCNRREGEVLTSFAEAIRNDRGVKTIEDSLKVDKRTYHRHDYYNLVMRPSNYLDSMRIVLRADRRAMGAIIVHRDRKEGRFVMQEKRQLATIAPFIAHAVSDSKEVGSDAPLVDDDDNGLLIVDRAGKLQYASPEARRLLFLAMHPQVDARALATASIQFTLPPDVLQLCRNLVGVFEGKQPKLGPPVWRHQNPWGGFTFRAYWLNGGSPEPSPLIGIAIQHETPLAVKLITKLEQFPLSRRQMDIALLLAANHSHAEIARRMGMSEHTVVTHVRRIYEKLGVHNKAELMNKLLA